MMTGASATCEGKKLFMVKFNLSTSDTSSEESPTAGSSTALGSEVVSETAPAPAESMSRVAPGSSSNRAPFHVSGVFKRDQQLREVSGWRRVWVSLSRSAGVGDACCCEKARARRFVRHRSRVYVYDRSDAYKGGGVVASPPRQHCAVDGMEKDCTVPCLVYDFMEGDSYLDRLACRGSGALVSLTANERILVFSDVARGLAYLHLEVCHSRQEHKRAAGRSLP
jgi:hypothetical protein